MTTASSMTITTTALGLGEAVSESWSVEVNAITGQYNPTAGGDNVDINALSLDALWVFRRAGRVSPFLRIGGGYIDDDLVTGNSHASALAQAGGGLLIDLVENSSRSFVLQLRPEVLARWDFIDEGGTKDLLDYMPFSSPKGPAIVGPATRIARSAR